MIATADIERIRQGEEVTLVAPAQGFCHRHEMQPYGWVEMIDCRLVQREEPVFDFRQQRYTGTRIATWVVGTVSRSSYCGALWGGVHIGKRTSDRYPPGSQHECRIKRDHDLVCGVTIDIAM